MNISPGSIDADLQDVLAHYSQVQEAKRLFQGSSQLERIRTEEVLSRRLPPPPARILDVGGGPGVYASWLVAQGYEVDLVDPVPIHVEQARQKFDEQGAARGKAHLGDARQLEFAAETADAVLFLGPLYHLTEKTDRLKALREVWRVLRPGGVVFAAAISRFASLLDGFFRGLIDDPEFVAILKQDLRDGQHRNRTQNLSYFTTAFFHHPDEMRSEIEEAELEIEHLIAVEGPFWCLQNFEQVWDNVRARERMLECLRRVEADRALLGASAHLMAIARKGAVAG